MPVDLMIKPHHCGISVPDIEASVAWYCDVLGCSVAKRMDLGEGQIVFLQLGDFYIELFQMPGSRPSEDLQTPAGQDLAIQGTKHMAFVVDDVVKLREYFREKGIFMPEMPAAGDAAGRPVFIRDNSGIMLEFVPPTAP